MRFKCRNGPAVVQSFNSGEFIHEPPHVDDLFLPSDDVVPENGENEAHHK